MSIKVNNKIIAGLQQPLSYRYVGEIFQSALPINDPKVAALNGDIITTEKGYASFIQYFISLVALYPSLVCTEEQWQAAVTKYGSCGKFVVNKDTIRLPKITGFVEGLGSLDDLGKLTEAGLPNITSGVGLSMLGTNSGQTGAIVPDSRQWGLAGGTNPYEYTGSIDASKSNPIYGKSNTVQPQSIKYPYYIVLATGVTQDINVKEEIKINNPYSLLDVKWSDKKLNNLSWLLSSGQGNSADTYPSVYEHLLKEYNEGTDQTITVSGTTIKYKKGKTTDIKITTDKLGYDTILNKCGTAWFYVLDTSKRIFYLPQTNGNLQFGGTGEFVEAGLPNITGDLAVSRCMHDYGAHRPISTGAFNATADGRTSIGSGASSAECHKYDFDASRSNPIYGRSNTVQTNAIKGYLYFYVGETIKNASLVNVATVIDNMGSYIKKNECPAYIIESYVNGDSGYNIYSNGYCEQWGRIPNNGNVRSNSTVNLLKNYINTNYNIQITSIDHIQFDALNNWTYTSVAGSTYNKAVGSFIIHFNYGGRYWRTNGYTKVEKKPNEGIQAPDLEDILG